MAAANLFDIPFQLPTTNTSATGLLLASVFLVGVIVLANQALHFLHFIWFYFLRPSSVHKYLHGPVPYAIVTGATDGIGKATAIELFRKGFNLIIHGRNETKVQKVVEEINAHGNGDVRYFLADAAKGGHDFARLLEPFGGLNITLVIHNVGGLHQTRDRYVAGKLVKICRILTNFYLGPIH